MQKWAYFEASDVYVIFCFSFINKIWDFSAGGKIPWQCILYDVMFLKPIYLTNNVTLMVVYGNLKAVHKSEHHASGSEHVKSWHYIIPLSSFEESIIISHTYSCRAFKRMHITYHITFNTLKITIFQ